MTSITICDGKEWSKDLSLFNFSIFITDDWINIVSSNIDKPVFLDFFEDNQKIGKIAGLIVNKGNTKGRELYFYAGPAIKSNNSNIYNNCLKAIYTYARKHHFSRIIINSYDNKHSIKCTYKKYFLSQRVEYVAKLDSELTQSSRFKRNVKKALKTNPSFFKSNQENDLQTLKGLIKETQKRQSLKTNKYFSPYYLYNLNDKTLRDLIKADFAKFYCTKNQEGTNCIELMLHKHNSTYMLLKGTNTFGYKNGMPSYLSNEVMKALKEDNMAFYNQGGRPYTKEGDGLSTFKISMGAKEIMCYGATTNYLTWPLILFNPLMKLGRRLPKNNALVNFLKRFI